MLPICSDTPMPKGMGFLDKLTSHILLSIKTVNKKSPGLSPEVSYYLTFL